MFTATSKIEIVIRKQLFLQGELEKYVCMYKQTYFSSILSIVFKRKFPLYRDKSANFNTCPKSPWNQYIYESLLPKIYSLAKK